MKNTDTHSSSQNTLRCYALHHKISGDVFQDAACGVKWGLCQDSLTYEKFTIIQASARKRTSDYS